MSVKGYLVNDDGSRWRLYHYDIYKTLLGTTYGLTFQFCLARFEFRISKWITDWNFEDNDDLTHICFKKNYVNWNVSVFWFSLTLSKSI